MKSACARTCRRVWPDVRRGVRGRGSGDRCRRSDRSGSTSPPTASEDRLPSPEPRSTCPRTGRIPPIVPRRWRRTLGSVVDERGSDRRGIAGSMSAPPAPRPRCAGLRRGDAATRPSRHLNRRRRTRRQGRRVEAEAEIATGVLPVGEVGRIGGRRRGPRPGEAHGEAIFVVAGDQRQSVRPRHADHEHHGEHDRTGAGEPAQRGQPPAACPSNRQGRTLASARGRRAFTIDDDIMIHRGEP